MERVVLREKRADLRAGQICAVVAGVFGAKQGTKPISAADFFPLLADERSTNTDESATKARLAFAAAAMRGYQRNRGRL